MPVYDYRCEKGHRFEAVQSMSDKPITKCEECGAPVRPPELYSIKLTVLLGFSVAVPIVVLDAAAVLEDIGLKSMESLRSSTAPVEGEVKTGI